jgi:mannose-6-phosphate isomerase-like protein (cupin superfamily)
MSNKKLTSTSPETGVHTIDDTGGKWCVPEYPVGNDVSGKCIPGFVDKTWGSEHIYQNNDKYCLKVLSIEEGQNCSMHFHINKHETMLVVEGTLAIDIIYDKQKFTKLLKPWEAFTISPGLPHSLRSVKGTVRLIEASTPDYDHDSIRIY